MQLKEKRNNKLSRKSQLIIVGSLLIIIGLSIIGYKLYTNYNLDKQDEITIDTFFEEQEQVDDNTTDEETTTSKTVRYEPYIAVIEIPNINVRTGMYEKTSKNNNVNRSVEILKKADMPDVTNGNFIIAGHSGNGRVSYFKNLYKLNIDDTINIYFGGVKYVYKIIDIYDIDKTGKLKLKSYKDKTILTMITCRTNTDKQIIVISELVEKG